MAGPVDTEGFVHVRVFSLLRAHVHPAELGHEFEWHVPFSGSSGTSIADELGLPPELIEGMFVNHTVRALDHVVWPGDTIAFVPYGTPGPHRVYLGLYDAGRDQAH